MFEGTLNYVRENNAQYYVIFFFLYEYYVNYTYGITFWYLIKHKRDLEYYWSQDTYYKRWKQIT